MSGWNNGKHAIKMGMDRLSGFTGGTPNEQSPAINLPEKPWLEGASRMAEALAQTPFKSGIGLCDRHTGGERGQAVQPGGYGAAVVKGLSGCDGSSPPAPPAEMSLGVHTSFQW